MNGIELITEKRNNHSKKGWDRQHDAEHDNGELAVVASTLAVKHTQAFVDEDAPNDKMVLTGFLSNENPWGLENNPDIIDRLAVAGSLIAAEIDRLIAIQNER